VAPLQRIGNGLGVSHHRLGVLRSHDAMRAPVCRDVGAWQSLTVPAQEAGWQPTPTAAEADGPR
jgi:hypothetical protein